MTLAEKYIRQYNRFNGKKISKKDLAAFHARLKEDIDARRIDAHVRYGADLVTIEKRIRKALPKVSGKVKVVVDKPVKISTRKPRNIIITQTAQGPEVVKTKGKAIHYHHEDLTILTGLPCDDPEADEPGLGFTRDGQQKIYDMVTNMMLETMKKDGLFWRKTWDVKRVKGGGGRMLAQNFVSKTVYRGVNYWITNFAVPKAGLHSPYFLTFKQVTELKGKVKKGAKAWPIVYYTMYYIITKPAKKSITASEYDAMSMEERQNKGALKLPVLQYYNVFNADQIEGIEFPAIEAPKPVSEAEKIESAEKIVREMPKAPPIAHGGDSAHYVPSTDRIQMPPLASFDKEQEYYSTLFHEMVHSTGHESRLGRKFGRQGTKEYAFEELIAELGASYLCAEAGTLYFTLNNSAAYLKHWLSRLQDIMSEDKKFFLMAAAKAQAAADFILDTKQEKPEEEKPVKVSKRVTPSRGPVRVHQRGIKKNRQLSGKQTDPMKRIIGRANVTEKDLVKKYSGQLIARYSAHIEEDIKRNWSSWNFGQEGFHGTREELDQRLSEITDRSPFWISGFDVFPEHLKEFEFRELYENYWVVVDTRGKGLSCHVLNSDNLRDAFREISDRVFDGTGDGEFVDCSSAKVIFSSEKDEWGLHILWIPDESAPKTLNASTKRISGVKQQPKLHGVVDASQIREMNFSRIELDGDYKGDFLKIYSDTQVMIWGAPGSGKTVYTLKFAQYLADKKNLKVLYIANEELGRSTFAEKINAFNIGHANLKFVKSPHALQAAGMSIDDFDVIFFDSINSMGWTLEDYRKFCDQYPGKIKVLIVQSTKDGDFRGGKDWEHEVDVAGEVKSRKMILRKNRLDEGFAKKRDKLLIEEQVNEQKRKRLIKEKVNSSKE